MLQRPHCGVSYSVGEHPSDHNNWQTDFKTLLVLMRRGAVPVKISTGNIFPGNTRELKFLSFNTVLVLF